ncbi:RBR-type E3 ubiquitin transferase [Ranunculus cassubicifolius]
MEAYDDDFELAFELQMQEAMTDSLLQPQIGENDPETIELLLKLDQERKDREKCMAEMYQLRHDLKIRIHDQKFAQEILDMPEDEWERDGVNVQKPFAIAGASSSSSSSSQHASTSTAQVASDDDDVEPFKLYFKGLVIRNEKVGEEDELQMIAAIGVAVCDPRGNSILDIQKPLVDDWGKDWETEDLQFKVEVEALIQGLNAAVSLDLRKIDYFCEHYPLFQHMTTKCAPKRQEIGTMIEQLLLLQQNFNSCRPLFVARNDVKFAIKLARDAIEAQMTRSAESSGARNMKELCSICFENVDVGNMFVIDSCLHRYCRHCMKQHVEAKLLNGMLPHCPHEGCNTQLDTRMCRRFLPVELLEMMNKRIMESSIPVAEKIYCPYPTCSALMSEVEVSRQNSDVFLENAQSARKCIKCNGLFCINCKVPWHINVNCRDYKRSNSNADPNDAKLKSLAQAKSWRQCSECSFIIERTDGCYHITCRCGYEFCYTCGAGWRNKIQTCSCPIFDEPDGSDSE